MAEPTFEAARPAAPVRYRTQSGDTVYGLARQFGVPMRVVIDSNNLEPPFVLQVGQTLVIPRPQLHQVANGETIYSISRRYGADMAELIRQNAIDSPSRIIVGQQLVIPGPGLAEGAREDPQAAGVQVATLPRVTRTPSDWDGPPLPQRKPGPAGQGTATAERPLVPVNYGTSATSRNTGPRGKRGPIPQPPARKGGKFQWPVNGRVILGYGPKASGLHNDGINIAVPRGTPINAAENGVVAYAGNELRGFGNLLLIKHSDGWVTAYAHTEGFLVKRGDVVRRGQTIARVGSSGNVSRPQLHFEVRKGTRAIDPTRMLGPRVAAATS